MTHKASRCAACNGRVERTAHSPFLDVSDFHQPRGLLRQLQDETAYLEQLCPECYRLALVTRNHPFPLARTRITPNDKPTSADPSAKLCAQHLSDSGDSYSRQIIVPLLEAISRLANDNDERAIKLLIDVAYLACDHLDALADRRPNLLQPLVRKMAQWPSFIGPKRRLFSDLREIRLKELQIGADNLFAGRWQHRQPATIIALAMHRWLSLNEAILRLPDPKIPGAASKWFDIGWRALLVRTRGHPESDRFLKRLGQRGLKRVASRYKGGETSD